MPATPRRGYAAPDNDVEVVNVRLVALGRVDKPVLQFDAPTGRAPLLEHRSVWFGEWLDCPVYLREALPPGHAFTGPAIVEEAGGTSVVPPGWNVTVHESGALLCRAPHTV